MKNTCKFLVMLWFGLFFSTANAQSVVIPVNSVWKYYDRPQALASNWASIEFDDSSWALGKAQIGFGEGDEHTLIAKEHNGQPILVHYFRHKFSWDTQRALTSVALRLLVDDGARVYLNNQEVHRQFLPKASHPETQLALGSLIEHSWYEVALKGQIELKRENILAVEVRQVSTTSSDLSFNLELIIEEN
ncbi:hypothetical protein [Pseudoalteromonas obscura]|uniref:Uncharacterized protein n=1 Tax=Pseudoalteromonas obscura TaxID=3048491 RepID=A0ABT7EIC9_9GAMM|nr:hypothetical protein [Pseudoalteromonas sp. P94(2023)]MDK2594773.1 hypothetical protein [Pseudoalteromonas sp. P94(2023)]